MGAGPSIIYGGSYANVTATTAALNLAQGIGVLRRLCINSTPNSTDTITIYDNTAANTTSSPNAAIIATLTIGSTDVPSSLQFDATYGVGLTVKTASTGTLANYTFVYQ